MNTTCLKPSEGNHASSSSRSGRWCSGPPSPRMSPASTRTSPFGSSACMSFPWQSDVATIRTGELDLELGLEPRERLAETLVEAHLRLDLEDLALERDVRHAARDVLVGVAVDV